MIRTKWLRYSSSIIIGMLVCAFFPLSSLAQSQPAILIKSIDDSTRALRHGEDVLRAFIARNAETFRTKGYTPYKVLTMMDSIDALATPLQDCLQRTMAASSEALGWLRRQHTYEPAKERELAITMLTKGDSVLRNLNDGLDQALHFSDLYRHYDFADKKEAQQVLTAMEELAAKLKALATMPAQQRLITERRTAREELRVYLPK